MLGLLLPLVAFYIFASIYTDGAAAQARWQIFTLSLIATMLLGMISSSMPTRLGQAVACLVASTVSMVGLLLWIKVTWRQAFKITGSYLGFIAAYSAVMELIFSHVAA